MQNRSLFNPAQISSRWKYRLSRRGREGFCYPTAELQQL